MKKALISAATLVIALSIFTGTVGGVQLDDGISQLEFGVLQLEYESALAALETFAPDLEPLSMSPNRDFVVGGFQAFGGWNNGISVHSGPNGEEPKGHASATQPDFGFKIREDAVCLEVLGNLAAVGFRGTFNAFGPDFVYEEIVLMSDGGPGGTFDRFFAFLPGEVGAIGPEQCALALPLAAATAPIERGNIVVNDAP